MFLLRFVPLGMEIIFVAFCQNFLDDFKTLVMLLAMADYSYVLTHILHLRLLYTFLSQFICSFHISSALNRNGVSIQGTSVFTPFTTIDLVVVFSTGNIYRSSKCVRKYPMLSRE